MARQDLPYGSPAWHARYAALRNTIEGLNGYAKDTAHQALAQPARRRVRGIAAQSIFTALLLMAANIRKIRAWRALTARDKARITGAHDGGGPACATTSPTADQHKQPPPPRYLQPRRSATPRASPQHRNRPTSAPGKAGTAMSIGVRARRQTKNQVTARVLSVRHRQFCR